ncbi:MAG: hypothetical protein ACOYID_09650 [Eubacteriales bacterium]
MLKRVISLLLALVISFSCIACAEQAKKAADTVAEPETTLDADTT